MSEKPSRAQFIEGEIERAMTPLILSMPKERIDFLREELRALLESHPSISALVDRMTVPDADDGPDSGPRPKAPEGEATTPATEASPNTHEGEE